MKNTCLLTIALITLGILQGVKSQTRSISDILEILKSRNSNSSWLRINNDAGTTYKFYNESTLQFLIENNSQKEECNIRDYTKKTLNSWITIYRYGIDFEESDFFLPISKDMLIHITTLPFYYYDGFTSDHQCIYEKIKQESYSFQGSQNFYIHILTMPDLMSNDSLEIITGRVHGKFFNDSLAELFMARSIRLNTFIYLYFGEYFSLWLYNELRGKTQKGEFVVRRIKLRDPFELYN